MPGTLLYVKPALTGTEPADVLNYAARETGFPHQSTADQWFDETRFESYRKLGQHIAHAVFAPVVVSAVSSGGATDCEKVIEVLRASWRT